MSTHMWLRSIAYRLGQVRQQLGFVVPLTKEDYKEVARVLPSSAAFSLFRAMSPADQQHALRVCRGLQARGCTNEDMLAAALLHDVGKAQSRVPFWTRPAIVLGKKLAPQLLSRLVLYPKTTPPSPRNPMMQMNPAPMSQMNPAPMSQMNPAPMSQMNPPMPQMNHLPVGADLSRPSPIYRPPEKSPPSPQQYVQPHEDEHNPSIVGAMPCARPTPPYARPSSPRARPTPPYANPAPRSAHPTTPIPKWRQSLSNAWYHAEIGADLASAAGLSDRAVLYIRTHHQPGGPAAELHAVDEVS